MAVITGSSSGIETALLRTNMEAGGFTHEDLTGRTPLGRLAEPREVACAVAFIASDDAAYITGSSLLVEGGWLADGGWRGA